MRFIRQTRGGTGPSSDQSFSHGHRKKLAVINETAYEDDGHHDAGIMPGSLLTVTPFPVQLCCKIVKMADVSGLGFVEFAGKVLDDVWWELRWKGRRRFQGEARLQGRGSRTRVRGHIRR